MEKCILVLLDGLRYDVAIEQMGYLNHLASYKKAGRYKGQAETPSNSRPAYEAILTGTPAWKNGITSNAVVRKSHEKSIFDWVHEAKGTTAAAAYLWVSELYSRAPFNRLTDRFQFDGEGTIKGIYYWEDDYPDTHLFADAHYLLSSYSPDFLLAHSMNIDHAGHLHGSDSIQYRVAVNKADTILASYLPLWMEAGYHIIVTSDHGIDEFRLHGGPGTKHCETPLFILSDKVPQGFVDETIPCLQLAAKILEIMGLN